MLNVNVSVIEFAWRKMSQNYPNFAVGFLSMNIEMEKNRPYIFLYYMAFYWRLLHVAVWYNDVDTGQ